MEFFGIIGDRGSGKTNLLTAILHDQYANGKTIISNFHLSFPYTLMGFSDLIKLGPEIHRATIGMDELGRGADSYDFFLHDVRRITTLISEIRKRECIVWYTVQRWNLIAKRLRDQTDGFILCVDADQGHPPEKGRCQGLFNLTFINSDFHVVRRARFDGRPFWDMYDTEEIIWGYQEQPKKKKEGNVT